MSKQPTEEDTVNALIVEIKVLENTYNEFTVRQNLLERALLEYRAALDTLNGIGDEPPTEVLVQIGGGAILRSQPPSTDRVLVGVGAGVVIEKPKAEAIILLEDRSREAEKTVTSIASQRNEIAKRLDSDRQALSSLASRQSED